MRTRIFTLITFLSIFVPSMVMAHPGHGTYDGISIWHYLTSPVHLISAVAIVAVNILAIRYAKKRDEQTDN